MRPPAAAPHPTHLVCHSSRACRQSDLLPVRMRTSWPRRQLPVVRADPQRAKTSLYGTLDLHSGCEIIIESRDMDGAATVQHLEQVLATYQVQRIPLLWDRASWHGGQLVRQLLAANPRLEVLSSPVADPDLNAQKHAGEAAHRAGQSKPWSSARRFPE